jgi:hypothetical protein
MELNDVQFFLLKFIKGFGAHVIIRHKGEMKDCQGKFQKCL